MQAAFNHNSSIEREIRVSAANVNFKVEGDCVVTSNGTEIVRYFGHDRELHLGKKVQILRKSCFERCDYLEKIDFEVGAEPE
jgi:hypothetical protein